MRHHPPPFSKKRRGVVNMLLREKRWGWRSSARGVRHPHCFLPPTSSGRRLPSNSAGSAPIVSASQWSACGPVLLGRCSLGWRERGSTGGSSMRPHAGYADVELCRGALMSERPRIEDHVLSVGRQDGAGIRIDRASQFHVERSLCVRDDRPGFPLGVSPACPQEKQSPREAG